MERLSKASIGLKGLASSVEDAIAAWRPPALSNEAAYSNSLAEYLRAVLPDDARVEREYRHQGTTSDVCVVYNGLVARSELFIEVKRNLRKKPDFDRLVGQVEGLRPKEHNVFVVLVGNTDLALLGRLREQFEGYTDGFLSNPAFRIVLVAG